MYFNKCQIFKETDRPVDFGYFQRAPGSIFMKTLLAIFCFLFCNTIFSYAYSKNKIIEDYIKANTHIGKLSLNHGPVDINIGSSRHGVLFFLYCRPNNFEGTSIFGIIYDHFTKKYYKFGPSSHLVSYSDGVISIFYENIDTDPGNEIIVINEWYTRTYYQDMDYAGTRTSYRTRVFKYEPLNETIRISEYKSIGDLLTVNLPKMGTFEEEIITGREEHEEKLRTILGVTYNSNQVRKRIRLLKKNGFLGGEKP